MFADEAWRIRHRQGRAKSSNADRFKMVNSRDRNVAGVLTRIVATLALATMFALVKLAGDRNVHIVESLFYRQAFAIPLVVGAILMSGLGWDAFRTTRPIAHAWRTVVGMTGMALNFTTFLLLPLAEATVLGFMVPLFATILATIFLHEPTGRYRWSAIAIGLLGVILAVRPGSGALSAEGIAVGLTAAIVVAAVSITLRQIGRTEQAITTVAWFTILSLIPLGLLMLRYGRNHDSGTWALLLGIGVTGGIAQLTLTASLRLAPVSVVLPMDYLSLLWALALGWLVFGTVPAGTTWAGIPLVVGAGLIIIAREHRLRRERQALAGPSE